MPPTALILSNTFHPHGVVASVRVTNWARLLPDIGWRCVSVARWYGQTATPAMLAEAVDPSARLWYLDGPDAGRPIDADAHAEPNKPETSAAASSAQRGGLSLAKAAVDRTVGRLIVPDAQRVQWARFWPSVRRVIKAESPDVVITSGPTHSIHRLGLRVAATGVPWIADFRDPYLLDARFRPKGLARGTWPWHVAFERAVYARASAVTHAIPVHARWARRRYRLSEDRCITLTHPCPRDLADEDLEPAVAGPSRRSVRVVGVIGEAEARSLALGVTRVSAMRGEAIELRLVGPQSFDLGTLRSVLGDRLIATGVVSHDEAKRQIAGADALVSYLSPERSRHIGVSSKLYEFLAARRPIIAINPTRPDQQLLRRLPDVPMLFEPDDESMFWALQLALDHRARFEFEMSARARALRERHSWELHALCLERALERAIGARGPASARTVAGRPTEGAGG